MPASVAAGAAIGIGLGPTAIERVVGVYKAYQTRVGNGPMPTELFDENAELLRGGGGGVPGTSEYGPTTGRARRCGWFDGVLARQTSRLNGVTSVALTRLDSLSAFDSIRICVAYELDDERITSLPASLDDANRLKPIYEELPGWKQDVTEVRQPGRSADRGTAVRAADRAAARRPDRHDLGRAGAPPGDRDARTSSEVASRHLGGTGWRTCR